MIVLGWSLAVSRLPPLALMTHASAIDARHALTDRSTWGVYITQQLCEGLVFTQAEKLAALPSGTWAALVEHVGNATRRLSATLPGNHMFFLGEDGARRTVQTLKLLRQAAADVAGGDLTSDGLKNRSSS